MFQLVRHRMEHRHTVSPLWHGFLLEGLSVLHAFTCDARPCETKRREQEGEEVVEVLSRGSLYQGTLRTYRVRLAAGFGSHVEVNVPVDTVCKKKKERENTRTGQCTNNGSNDLKSIGT